MTKVEAQALAKLLISTSTADDAPKLLHDAVAERLVEDRTDLDMFAALELVEPHLKAISAFIALHRSKAEQAGDVWVLELHGSEDEYIRGSSFQDASLPEREQQVRLYRRHIELLKTELLALSPSEFETACTAILRIMGCSDPFTSPQRNDGGIDFYGRLEMEGRLDDQLPYGGIDRRTGVWLVGQAKHYPTNAISTAPIRELVGSIELARTGGAIHTWKGLMLRPFDAVIHMFFTTGRFSADALRLVEQTGLVVMNGAQLSAFLADAGIGIDSITNVFSAAKFRSDLCI